MNDVRDAMRLIYLTQAGSQLKGKKGRMIMRSNVDEYRKLMQRYHGEEGFRHLVGQMIEAADMQLLNANSERLQISSASADAMWATTASDYKLRLGKADIPTSRLLIIHLAIAMVFFPEAEDLEAEPEDLGVLTVSDTLRELEKFAKAAEALEVDDELLNQQELNALTDFAELPPLRPDSSEKNADSWVGLINRVIDHMVDSHYLIPPRKVEEGSEPEYWMTRAYQHSFKEGAKYLFDRFRILKQELDSQDEIDEILSSNNEEA
ncbi:hypothetical protein ACOMICROBIO_NCLOACGD_02449 [Vibrio sp. B1ASS3]|uniref:hypothetical protein n=1 Tax=Vibrio sp. B1ASS3 TaxID=2751176 RepID=UPI001ABAA717|nr:hypothetical protein [Vibrio sp. B1ASS3]CAD7811860.1 hypothetical protein ACOMICROBIO_NCLOACGD_02449 [Vibrio sp. B1ASS3]CAE6916090.1 hypothetical protein ACOMICROBIO_NCLOACGD_02449 [Vibrio sp. B1ASS3]